MFLDALATTSFSVVTSRKCVLTALLVFTTLLPFSAQAAQVTWSGTAGSWGDPQNWLGNTVPTNSDLVEISSGATSLSSGVFGTYEGLLVGSGSGNTGSVVVSGGLLSGSDVAIGMGGGSSGSLAVNSGTFASSGTMQVGGQGMGLASIDGGSLLASQVFVGSDSFLGGALVLQSGSMNATTLYTSGTAIVSLNGGALNVGSLALFSGSSRFAGTTVGTQAIVVGYQGSHSMRVSGGTISVADSIALWSTEAGSAQVTLYGGSISAKYIYFKSTGDSVSTLTVNGGTISGVTSGIDIDGDMILNGGLVSVGGANGVNVGMSGAWGVPGKGSLVVNGGTMRTSFLTIGSDPDMKGVAIINPGGEVLVQHKVQVGRNGAGSFTVTGTEGNRGLLSTGELEVSSGGTLTLDGGILRLVEEGWSPFGRIAVTLGSGGGIFDIQQPWNDIDHLTGPGSMTKVGSGTAILRNENDYTGETIVAEGTLRVDGSNSTSSLMTVKDAALLTGSGTTGNVIVEAGGTLDPGDIVALDENYKPIVLPGLLTVDGALTFEAGSTLVMEIASSSLYDQLVIASTFTAGGTLFLDVGFTPLEGDFFTLFTDGFAGRGWDNGSFTIASNLPGGLGWDTSQLATSGVVIVVPEPSTVALLGLGLAAALLRYRHR